MTTGEAEIRILVADEHALFREAIAVGLQREAGFDVVAQAGDGMGAIAEARRSQPDIAIIDSELSNCDGPRAVRMLREHVPDCHVIVLAPKPDGKLLVDVLEAGAAGFLTKERPLADLASAIRSVIRGECVVSGSMLRDLVDRLLRRRKEQEYAIQRVSRLSHRERQVLALLVAGGDNDAIAQSLVISPQTARTHIQNVLNKLNVHSRLEAAAFIRRNDLLDDLREVPPPFGARRASSNTGARSQRRLGLADQRREGNVPVRTVRVEPSKGEQASSVGG